MKSEMKRLEAGIPKEDTAIRRYLDETREGMVRELDKWAEEKTKELEHIEGKMDRVKVESHGSFHAHEIDKVKTSMEFLLNKPYYTKIS